MLKIDLHTHTLNSKCGQHTLLEVLNIARGRGMELIAITDHGPAQGGTVRGTFFQDARVPHEFDGVRLLKGLEANVLDADGHDDVPRSLLERIDILLAGLHPSFGGKGLEDNTRAVLNILESGPAFDMISHPDIRAYPLNLERVVPAAADKGVILEINDANLVLGKTDLEKMRELLALGAKHGALFAVNSDGHTWAEFGRDDSTRRALREFGSPAIDIVNDWPLDKVLAHFAARRSIRRG
ncbi:MAG: PHP domain-containing protein [Candidatus Sumerlaeota bacterium]|nr:PHP domain-containing protein [Candidatus Sumerlaeota bacterium]